MYAHMLPYLQALALVPMWELAWENWRMVSLHMVRKNDREFYIYISRLFTCFHSQVNESKSDASRVRTSASLGTSMARSGVGCPMHYDPIPCRCPSYPCVPFDGVEQCGSSVQLCCTCTNYSNHVTHHKYRLDQSNLHGRNIYMYVPASWLQFPPLLHAPVGQGVNTIDMRNTHHLLLHMLPYRVAVTQSYALRALTCIDTSVSLVTFRAAACVIVYAGSIGTGWIAQYWT